MWGVVQDAFWGVGVFSYILSLLGSLWGLFRTLIGPQLWPLVRSYLFTSYRTSLAGSLGGTYAYQWLSENLKTRRTIYYDGQQVPGPGWYSLKHSGVRFLVEITEERYREASPLYFANFYTFKSRKWFENWVQSLGKDFTNLKVGSTLVAVRVLTPSGSVFLGRKRARTSQSLVFEDDLHVKIKGELIEFFQDEQYYVDRGIPWTLGYLLHGPPGTGKSSIPFYLAGRLHKDILIIPAKLLKLPDFSQIFLQAWEQDMLCLFDDIDGILGCRPGQPTSTSQEVLHELLGLLDSPLSPHGFVFFMTTNYPEILDEAMIRPGRIDRKYYVGIPKQAEVMRLFKFFYPEGDEKAFLAIYGGRKCSPAALSAYFSRYRDVDKLLRSIDTLDALSEKPRASFEIPTFDLTDEDLKLLPQVLSDLSACSDQDFQTALQIIFVRVQLSKPVARALLSLVAKPRVSALLAGLQSDGITESTFDLFTGLIREELGSILPRDEAMGLNKAKRYD